MEMGFSYKRYGFFAVVLLFALMCCVLFTTYLPFLTYASQALDVQQEGSLFSFAIVSAGTFLSLLFHGWLFDHYGGHAAFFSGQTFIMAGLFLVVFANDPQEFLMATIVLSLGSGSGLVLARAWLFSLLAPKDEVIGITAIHLITLFMLSYPFQAPGVFLSEEGIHYGAIILLFFLSVLFVLTQSLFSYNTFRERRTLARSSLSFSWFIARIPCLIPIWCNAGIIIAYYMMLSHMPLSDHSLFFLNIPYFSAIFTGFILYVEKSQDPVSYWPKLRHDLIALVMSVCAFGFSSYSYSLAGLFWVSMFVYQFYHLSQVLRSFFQKEKKAGSLSASIGWVQYSAIVAGHFFIVDSSSLSSVLPFLGLIGVGAWIMAMSMEAKYPDRCTNLSQ